jgi:hypothetical protein
VEKAGDETGMGSRAEEPRRRHALRVVREDFPFAEVDFLLWPPISAALPHPDRRFQPPASMKPACTRDRDSTV